MDENKNPILKKEELTDETLEQVSGGVNLPLNMGANESSSEAASASAAAVDSRPIPAEQPIRRLDRHMPTPIPKTRFPERDPRSM